MTSPSIAVTARLSPELKADADAYAARLGLSFNGLLLVALRDYLDGRRSDQTAGEAGKVRPVEVPSVRKPEPLPRLSPSSFKPPKRPRDYCPCQSGRQWRHCHALAKPSSV